MSFSHYDDDVSNYPTGSELADYLKQELVGKRIVQMRGTEIELDNGKILEIEPNEGCDSCSNGRASIHGDYITAPTERAILDVRYVEWETNGDASAFSIFILTTHKHDSNLYDTVSLNGYDAFDVPSYYGTGFWVKATFKEGMEPEAEEPENVVKRVGHKNLPGAMGYMANRAPIRPKKLNRKRFL